MNFDFDTAFSRNLGLLSRTEQGRIARYKVAIPGMGGVGGVHFLTLVRAGFTRFAIADFDTFELQNFNRQIGADLTTVDRPKVDVLVEMAKKINPNITVDVFDHGISPDTIDLFLNEVDLVVDGLDVFVVSLRRKLFNRAFEKKIPVVTAGPIGFGASVLTWQKDARYSFDHFFGTTDDDSEEEAQAKFLLGITPSLSYLRYFDTRYSNIPEKRGSSLGLSCNICAGIAVAEAIKILLQRGKVRSVPYVQRFDAYFQTFQVTRRLTFLCSPFKWLLLRVLVKRLGVRASRPGPLPPALPPCDAQPTVDVIRYIVQAATTAPSGDNSQHWRFIWDGKSLLVRQDPSRTGFNITVRGDAYMLAYGAALENVRIAASAFGLEAHVTLLATDENSSDIATVTFTQTQQPKSSLFPSLFERCVVRKPYHAKAIPNEEKLKLQECINEIEGIRCTWIDQGEDIAALRKILGEADTFVWEIEQLHQDLIRWIRFTEESSDGLTPASLGAGALDMFALRWIASKWTVVRRLRTLRFPWMVTALSRKWLRHTPAFCVLSMQRESIDGYLDAGAALQRLWLTATDAGLSCQPMYALIALYRKVPLRDGSIPDDLFARASALVERFSRLVALGEGEMPFMVLRVGYSDPPGGWTKRRTVEEVFETLE